MPTPSDPKEIFLDVRELPAGEHAAFLDAACGGDAALRRRVEALLAADERAGTFLAGPTRGAGDGGAPEEQPSSVIGRFKLLQEIGEGGFGTVWLAEQQEPVRRQVALKVIKRGMDTRSVVARFEQERQALALMDHPNIAKVFDGGETPAGRPYFAMELVSGLPITQFCDQELLDAKGRLALFVLVCHAVQHAHQKGIIHRDLKPSNVLVTLHDGVPVPKVIDFGVAKAVDRPLSETLLTGLQQVVGTPEYMAPEQAELSGIDIDTRADIYSLGVLLYELLTGTLPFDARKLEPKGLLELLRVIREEEPQKPSTRIRALGASTTEMARRRRTDTRRLGRLLRGDLDWIVMKALEKDRGRRYVSADALAADVERHLRDEPVEVGPPGRVYRLQKYVRRHRGPLAAAVAVLIALVGGLAVAVWQYGKAASAATEARRNLDRFLQMRDVPIVQDLMREADEDLWPAHPDKVTRMGRWLERARVIEARLPEHRAALFELRGKAQPMSDELRQQAQELLALRKERDDKRALLDKARASGTESATRKVLALTPELADLDTRLVPREQAFEAQRWQFAAFEDRFLHQTLAELVRCIERVVDPQTGQLTSVVARRRQAETLAERSFGDEKGSEAARSLATAWRAAAARVSTDPRFAGFVLRPQLGLVPLGRDSESKLEEFAHLSSGEPALRDEQGKLVIADQTGIVLVLIPGGTFLMGAQRGSATEPNYDLMAENEESPVHEVTLEPYLLAKHEMTQGQWQRIAGENPSVYGPGLHPAGMVMLLVTLRHPVENVSWDHCVRMLGRLGLVLPTEAQWERAARAGTDWPWWTGKEKASLSGAANVCDACCKANGGSLSWRYEEDLDDGYALHAPVGSFRANGFGLWDVIGNVWEWCSNDGRYGEHALRAGDGGREVPGARDRVVRGGAWDALAGVARSAYRFIHRPGFRYAALGCRPARVITR